MTYGSEVWKWNEAEQTKIRAVEIKYLRAVSGVTIPGRMRNEGFQTKVRIEKLCMAIIHRIKFVCRQDKVRRV